LLIRAISALAEWFDGAGYDAVNVREYGLKQEGKNEQR
jgi:hypothetical protein